MPKISVIVPVYNVEKYIIRCISSISNQQFTNIEILLIDDGSTDSSLEICERLARQDKRIRVFHKSNGGLSDARNFGVKRATGSFITFVDSDDWLESDAISYLYSLLKKYNADFAMAENRRTQSQINAKKTQLTQRECLLNQREFLKKFFKVNTQINVQYAWAKLYKKELFENTQFPVGLTNEDVQATFEVTLNATKIAYSTKVIYNYFINPNSITTQVFSDKRLDLITVWSNVLKRALKTNDSWIIRNSQINYYRSLFGVLTNLALSSLSLKEKRDFLRKNDWLLKKFNSGYQMLLRAQIPTSRKLMIFCYRANYNMSLTMMHLITKLMRRVSYDT